MQPAQHPRGTALGLAAPRSSPETQPGSRKPSPPPGGRRWGPGKQDSRSLEPPPPPAPRPAGTPPIPPPTAQPWLPLSSASFQLKATPQGDTPGEAEAHRAGAASGLVPWARTHLQGCRCHRPRPLSPGPWIWNRQRPRAPRGAHHPPHPRAPRGGGAWTQAANGAIFHRPSRSLPGGGTPANPGSCPGPGPGGDLPSAARRPATPHRHSGGQAGQHLAKCFPPSGPAPGSRPPLGS